MVHDVVWDPSMCQKQVIQKYLWDKALTQKIKNNEETQFLNEHLQSMKDPIKDAPITTENISQLI